MGYNNLLADNAERSNPYIHSNYYNFRRAHYNITFKSNKGRIEAAKARVESLNNSLISKTQEFLGGGTIKPFYKYSDFNTTLKNSNEKSIEDDFGAFILKKLQNSGFQRYVREMSDVYSSKEPTSKMKEKTSVKNASLTQFIMNFGEKTLNEVLNSKGKNMQNKLTNYLMENVTSITDLKQKSSNDSEINKILISLIGRNFQEELKKITEKGDFKKYLGNKISTKNSTTKFEKSTRTYSDIVRLYLLSTSIIDKYIEYRRSQKGGQNENINIRPICEDYINKFIEELRKITKKDIDFIDQFSTARGNKTIASGFWGEYGLKAEMAANGIKVEVLGSDTEEEARKKINRKKNVNFSAELIKAKENSKNKSSKSTIHESFKAMDKQSRVDVFIINPINQRAAGVQSKNYLYSSLKKGNIQNIPVISPHSNETIFDLANRLNSFSGGTVIDVNSFTYTLANMLWFSYAGSINRKTEAIETFEDPGVDKFTQEIGGLFADFLGISYLHNNEANFEVIPEYSNLFFALNSDIIVPTCKILEKVIAFLEEGRRQAQDDDFFSSSLKSAFSGKSEINEEDARALKEEKKKAVGNEGLRREKEYSNGNLIKVGKEKGKNLLIPMFDEATEKMVSQFMAKTAYMDLNLKKILNLEV